MATNFERQLAGLKQDVLADSTLDPELKLHHMLRIAAIEERVARDGTKAVKAPRVPKDQDAQSGAGADAGASGVGSGDIPSAGPAPAPAHPGVPRHMSNLLKPKKTTVQHTQRVEQLIEQTTKTAQRAAVTALDVAERRERQAMASASGPEAKLLSALKLCDLQAARARLARGRAA